MSNALQISEHMEVLGSDGQHIGTVDRVMDSMIKLTKSDPAADGQHHLIPIDIVESVGQNAVRLNCTAEQARRQWQSGNI